MLGKKYFELVRMQEFETIIFKLKFFIKNELTGFKLTQFESK